MTGSQQVELRQCRELTRHFSARLLENELVASEMESRSSVLDLLALVAVPGVIMTLYLLPKYAVLAHRSAAEMHAASLTIKFLFLSLSMILMGLFTSLRWEELFPDRRDYFILGPLPIRIGTLFAAKSFALIFFLAIFSVAVNGFSTVVYPIISTRGTLLEAVRNIGAHAAAVIMANTFVFCGLIAIQGLLLIFAGAALYRKLSRLLQFSLASSFLSFLYLIAMLYLFPSRFPLLGDLLQRGDSWFEYLPPVWFLKVYEGLGAAHGSGIDLAGHAGFQALPISIAAAVLCYLAAFRSYFRVAVETGQDAAPARSGISDWLTMRFVSRNPISQAVFFFVSKTMQRSQRQRLIWGGYLGAGVALAAGGLIAEIAFSRALIVDHPTVTHLSIPLILTFFAVVGLRMTFGIPTETEANWIFQITECGNTAPYKSGTRRVMWILGILPILAITTPIYMFLWRPVIVLQHLFLAVIFAAVLAEILIFRYAKLPFTCSFRPGKANLKVFWFLYLVCFMTYAYILAGLELWLMAKGTRFAGFFAVASVVVQAVVMLRRKYVSESRTLIFNDEPSPRIQTLGLKLPRTEPRA